MMSNTTISEPAMTAAIDALQRCEAVESAYLLGSAAAGRLRGDSDVDVAILLNRHASFSVDQRLALTAELARLFGRPVDLGVLSTANVVYAKEVVVHGRILFERSHAMTARFAMLTLSMYASLQAARREVLQAYAA
jgi:predicted nucleotidyltransferase